MELVRTYDTVMNELFSVYRAGSPALIKVRHGKRLKRAVSLNVNKKTLFNLLNDLDNTKLYQIEIYPELYTTQRHFIYPWNTNCTLLERNGQKGLKRYIISGITIIPRAEQSI